MFSLCCENRHLSIWTVELEPKIVRTNCTDDNLLRAHREQCNEPSTFSLQYTMDRFTVLARFLFIVLAVGVNHSAQVVYPYGPTAGDSQLRAAYEVSSPGIPLGVPVKFYNDTYDTIFVSCKKLLKNPILAATRFEWRVTSVWYIGISVPTRACLFTTQSFKNKST